jgi:hypothetical protein
MWSGMATTSNGEAPDPPAPTSTASTMSAHPSVMAVTVYVPMASPEKVPEVASPEYVPAGLPAASTSAKPVVNSGPATEMVPSWALSHAASVDAAVMVSPTIRLKRW